MTTIEQGRLSVGDGHEIAFTVSGNRRGQAVVVLHGGPGSGQSPRALTHFDLNRWRVIQFDQRGCGASTPHAGDPVTDLSANTTHHLIADIERLRQHFGIDRWAVVGGSWGATLALAYAARHRPRVAGLVLHLVTSTSDEEVRWITGGCGRFFPETHAAFLAALPPDDRDDDIAAAYNRLLMNPDPAIHQPAAVAWCNWEQAIVDLQRGLPPNQRYADPRLRLGFSRLVTHYWAQRAFLPAGYLIDAVSAFGDLPGHLIHGRLDIGSPLSTAWRLHQAWPGSTLSVIDGAGHDTRDASLSAAIAKAIAQLVS